MVRVAAHPFGLRLPPWPDLTGTTNRDVQRWRCWLGQVWAQDVIAQAIEVASPVLARRVCEVCAGQEQRVSQVRRAVVSVVRYVLRMTSRATPFGLFAGVAPVRFGAGSAVRYGEGHHVVARVDALWLAEVITRLETCAELRHRLPVVLNNLAFVRDGRLVVGCQQQSTRSSRMEPAEVSVRHSRAVETAVQAARSPIRVGELAGKLRAEFPATPESVIEGMLAGLVAARILLTSLHPPMTATDPLAHVVGELTAVGAEEVPQAASLLQELHAIHDELSRHNRSPSPAVTREVRVSVSQRMAAIFPTERPLAVNLRVDCTVVLPHAVACEAEAAAAVLTRLTPCPSGPAAWREYHHVRFLERYGIGAVVPVSEILNAEAGLGFPAGYRDSRLELPVPGLSERDVRLLALAQNAAMSQSIEVILDEGAIADLMAEDFGAVQPQPHTELSFRVHAPTPSALDRGEFTLAVVGVSRAAGTTTGRFLDLLDSTDRDRMASVYAQLPTVNAGALPVQVSCPPLYPRTQNVTRAPAVLPHVVSLAEHHTGGGLIPLDDLAVSGDAQRLYLMSLSRGRPVEPVVFSAVELTNAAHPLLRFLCEISTARTAACGPFSWGAASRLPFLPRVRYRRTILSPARWRLAGTDLPGRNAPWRDWVASLQDWRHRVRVPDAVYLGADDRRIRLDLHEPAHLYLLRCEVDRTGHATVREAPDTEGAGWLDGRAHEIVVPLVATDQPRRPSIPRRAGPVGVISPDHGHLPGDSEWLFAKLYGHPDRHTAILTTHLSDLLSQWEQPPQWWFLPYRDPESHLRLRIRLPDVDAFGSAARRLGTWATGLRHLGLISRVQVDTYHPETGRFGSGPLMAAAEAVFAADSAAAVMQRTVPARPEAAHPLAVTSASLVDLAVSFLGDIGGGMRWLIDHIARDPGPAPARQIHAQALRLATPCLSTPRHRQAAIHALPGGERLTAAWARRGTALAGYREMITATEGIDPDAVLGALLHLHSVRTVGIDPDTERISHRLARAAALCWAAQDRRKKP